MNRRDVAKLAGVSEATVSRVMNNMSPIKESTKQKVLKAASELGYEVNAMASQLAKQKSGNLGVVLPRVPKVHLFSTYYFSEILSGISEVAQHHEQEILLIFKNPDESLDYRKWFRSKKIDSCIILGAVDKNDEILALEQLREANYPFCLVNQRYDGYNFLSVDGDHYTGSKLAINHLLKGQLRPVIFVNGPLNYSNSQDRLRGYTDALTEAGIKPNASWIFEGNYSRKSGYQMADKLAQLMEEEGISHIFAANDRMAFGIMEGLTLQGMEAGKDYAIVGYDNSDGARIVTPKLSSIAVPFYEIGKQAAHLLLSNNTNNQELESIVLPVDLVVRQSS